MKRKHLSLFVLLVFLVLQVLSPIGGKEVAVSAADGDEGVADLECTFTAVDGTSVSTSTDSGQSTVLIFGNTNCWNTRSTLKSIAASQWVSRSDIRVIFAETKKASSEDVQSFAADYACDDIICCYDENSANPDYDTESAIFYAMFRYYHLFYDSDSVVTPVTVVIDGENQVRDCLTGLQTADAIMDKMKDFVAAEPSATPSQEPEQGEGVANLDYTFTGVDGTSVSTSSTPGQATVIVFGNTGCVNTKNTLRSIAASSWVSRPDIRVIFAETSRKSSEEVKTYVAEATYGGGENITLCYDEGSGLNSAMWSYYALFHSGIFMSPVTVLIDGENRVRDCLTDYQPAFEIMDKMKDFVEQDEGEKTVSVNLAGTQNYDYAWEVLDLVNEARAEKGLPELQLDSALMDTAMHRAAEIAMYYSHTRPTGAAFSSASFRGTCKLENIAAGQITPTGVMEGWLNSPGHYANIMDGRVTSLGVGCFRDSQGVYYWVQYFDNESAQTPSNHGQKGIIKTVYIQKNFIHLHTDASRTFNEADKGTTIAMEVWQENENFPERSRPRLDSSGLSFSSSDTNVATVDEDGKITLKEPGTAVITASLKEDASVYVEQTITIQQNAPSPSSTPKQTVKPSPSSTPEQTVKPSPSSTPKQTVKPSPSSEPEQTVKPSPSSKPEQTVKPSPSSKPEQTVKPIESSEPEQTVKPVESSEPEQTVIPVQSSEPGQTVEPNPSSVPKPSPVPGTPTQPTEPAGEVPTEKPGVTPTVKPNTTQPGAVTPFVPGSPTQTVTPVIQPQTPPAASSVGKVESVKLKQKKQTVTVSWKEVSGAAGYQIWYSTSKKWKGKKQKILRKNKVTVKNLKKKKTYYFRVRAYRLEGTKKVYGGWSKMKRITIKKASGGVMIL